MDTKEIIIAMVVLFGISIFLSGTFVDDRGVVFAQGFYQDIVSFFRHICCGLRKEYSDDITIKTLIGEPSAWYWKCPENAHHCVVELKASDDIAYVGSTNCGYRNSNFVCDDDVQYQGPRTIRLEPGQYIHVKRLYIILSAHADIRVTVFVEKLMWCGDSPCGSDVNGIIGTPVQGADGCKFIINDAIYDENGNLIKKPKEGEDYAITVPTGICYLYKASRHICGQTCDECQTDDDCIAGHTYKYQLNGKWYGAECHTGRLYLYGCVDYGKKPDEDDLTIMPWEDAYIQFNFGHKCDVVREIPVQCCPGTATCGPNAYCDPYTFTCKQTAECRTDQDCGGVREECTYIDGKPTLVKAGVCENGRCVTKTVGRVECCYDKDCPYGYYCSEDHTCKQSAIIKKPCPYECCEHDPYYYDKPCPQGYYCVNHRCVTQPPPPECEWWDIPCWIGKFISWITTTVKSALMLVGLVAIIVVVVYIAVNKFIFRK